jgi:xeroderma pigmentosum group C-complementing protein
MFDPTPSTSTSARQENRMVYVVAFEEDGYGRDVTPRYAREYGAKVAKVQGGSKSRKEWWERVANLIRRPYRLVRIHLVLAFDWV